MTDQPIDVFAGLVEVTKKKKPKEEQQRSITFGGCPTCSANRVGLVRQGVHLAWRDHTRRTHGDISMQCPSVGQRLCEVAARDVWDLTGVETPVCPCS